MYVKHAHGKSCIKAASISSFVGSHGKVSIWSGINKCSQRFVMWKTLHLMTLSSESESRTAPLKSPSGMGRPSDHQVRVSQSKLKVACWLLIDVYTKV